MLKLLLAAQTANYYGGNGDGYMIYAGTPERIGGTQGIPLESMRLKHVRDGFEDFEWLTLLERVTSRAHVMNIVQRFMRSPSDYTDNVAAFEAVRLSIGHAIEVASQQPRSVVKTDDVPVHVLRSAR